ncbi:hypothetical protein NZA98_11365, partial [Escherichia coli]|nr:hypothetical protein [Escherichia coli]
LFDMLARKHLKFPEVLVLPDLLLNRPVAQLFRSVALDRNLPTTTIGTVERPFLESTQEGDAYLREALGTRH